MNSPIRLSSEGRKSTQPRKSEAPTFFASAHFLLISYTASCEAPAGHSACCATGDEADLLPLPGRKRKALILCTISAADVRAVFKLSFR